jgi:hypothetical protein
MGPRVENYIFQRVSGGAIINALAIMGLAGVERGGPAAPLHSLSASGISLREIHGIRRGGFLPRNPLKASASRPQGSRASVSGPQDPRRVDRGIRSGSFVSRIERRIIALYRERIGERPARARCSRAPSRSYVGSFPFWTTLVAAFRARPPPFGPGRQQGVSPQSR